MSKMNKSLHIDEKHDPGGSPPNQSFSEGRPKLNIHPMHYLSPLDAWQPPNKSTLPEKQIEPVPAISEPRDEPVASQRSEHALITTKPDCLPHGPEDAGDDSSFLRSKLATFSLKRQRTPNLELPQPEKMDAKLSEIGHLDKRNPVELLEEMRKEGPVSFYSLKYCVATVRHYGQQTCFRLTQNPVFEAISLLVILANCVVLALDDPTSSAQEKWQSDADYVFQALYSLEIAMKVCALGLVLNEGAYLRDPWNIMDAVIVVFGYLSLFQIGGGIDLKALRTFRILRPLRAISSVEGLRILIGALVTSLPLLMDTLVILLFFFMIFAIAGLQLWHGVLRSRCINTSTGTVDYDKVCGYETCGEGSVCVEGLGNPNHGATHFDDIFTALLTVFQCVSIEGWANTQLLTIRAFGPYAVIFYTPLVLIGSFFLLNFTLAVIKSRVTDLYNSRRRERQLAKIKKVVASATALQQEAENKITVGQLLGPKLASLQERSTAKIRILFSFTSIVVLLAQYSNKIISPKRTESTPLLRTAYKSILGFEELEKELQEEVAIVQPKKTRPIPEDVISEEDETPLNNSSSLREQEEEDNANSRKVRGQRFSCKVGGSHSRAFFVRNYPLSPKLPATPTLMNARKIELADGQKRKFAFKGMLGIRSPVPAEVKVAFSEGLDEFSDTFFGQQQNPPSRHSEFSSMDLESSCLPSISKSKEATPSANRSNESSSQQEVELPPEARKPFQCWKDIEHRKSQDHSPTETRRCTVLREQNTVGTAVSNSIASSSVPEKLQAQGTLRARMKPFPINLAKVSTTSNKEDLLPLESPPQLLQESPSPPLEEKKEEAEDAERVRWEANERLLEKYVLQDEGEIITSTSANDVRLQSISTQPFLPAPTAFKTLGTLPPPYKLKVRYEPTVLPDEDENDDLVKSAPGEGNTCKDSSFQQSRREDNNASSSLAAGESASNSRSLASSRRAPSVASKGKKKKRGRSKSKGKKKGRRNRLGSGSGSRSGSRSRRSLPSSANVVPQSASKKEADSLSAAGSVLSSARKSGKGTAEDEKKNGETAAEDDKEEEEPEGVKVKPKTPWSGQEVLPASDPYMAVYVTSYMSEARVWKRGWEGRLKSARSVVKGFITSNLLENLMNLLVIANTVLLAMDRYDQPESESSAFNIINIVFTSIFAVEMAAKLFGLGIIGYLTDPMNYLDGLVVLFSLAEIVLLDGQGALSAFRTLRIFRTVRMIRTLRVLRVARLLRSLRSMQLIIEVIGQTIGSFAYIGMLLLILIFIYALFGMQLYGGRFEFPNASPRQTFDSFHKAFLTMFQVLTMENWQDVLYSCMRVQTGVVSALYLVTWIFIGNYILLNLFLAIMLDAFTELDDSIEDEEEEESEELEDRPSPSRTTSFVNSSGTMTLGGTGTGSKTVGSSKARSQFAPPIVRKQKVIENNDLDDVELTKAAKEEETAEYNRIKCEYSLYLFPRENAFRISCWKICTSAWFEGTVIALICFASVKLAVDTYFLRQSNGGYDSISYGLDLFFTVSFAVEAGIKMVVHGFAFGPTTYLRDPWNVLDFFIVIASVVDAAVSQIDIPMIKVLRLLRTFRPLRFITHNASMRIIVTALFRSLGAIFNTLVVILVIWLMFSIVGVNFFAGKFQYCSIEPYANSDKASCMGKGGVWRTYDHNFDNSINGMIFLFVLTTQENWPSLVYQAVDCTDVDQGPERDSQWYYAYFFVVFIFVSSMFLLNLFVGVMFLNFTKVQRHETASFGDILITEEQLNWIEVQKMILRCEPNFNTRTVPPQYNWRKPFHQIVTTTAFEVFIAAVILLNMVQMAMLYEDASAGYLLALDVINYVFTGVFTIELIFKLIAFSQNFWYDAWNIFDFFIVICSYIDIIFTNVGATSLRMLRIGPQLIRVLRVLRVSRLLRLVKKYKRLQDIMEIVQLCLPSMLNVFSLLALVLFIYAVLGCYLFGDITEGRAINDFYNFSNFGLAIILCLKMATGEDWNSFMFDCARTSTACTAGVGCGNLMAYIYFLTFKLVVTFVMLNLFILIVLQLFEKFFLSTENIISKFKEDFENFQQHWQALGPSHSGFMLNQNKLIRFFASQPQPLGTEGMDINETTRTIIELGIRSNDQKDVFFNELLYCVMRRVYSNLYRTNAFIQNKERDTRRKIWALAESAAKRGHYKTVRKTFIRTANPFVSLMLLRMTMKMWKKYKITHQRHIEEHEKIGDYNYESSREDEVIASPKRKSANPTPRHRSRHQSPRVRVQG